MPELPEVETTLLGIRPQMEGQLIHWVEVRESRLRQPVSDTLTEITGTRVDSLTRRAKYLIAKLQGAGHLLIHLGMSGSLRICEPVHPLRKHDHVILGLGNGKEIRFHDPRRFGIFLHLREATPSEHPLLAKLGPEPLSAAFSSLWLQACCRGRKAAIKVIIMNGKVVVGVGNIYASEALFRAGIRPGTAAGRLSHPRLARLTNAIKKVLQEAIERGGTTLRDFLNAEGNPGYFRQQLQVYERAGLPCRSCGALIRQRILGQRSTYWCPQCQT